MDTEVKRLVDAFKELPEESQAKVLQEIQKTNDLMTDDELCERLGISRGTLFNHIKHGPPRGSIGGDIRVIQTCRVGQRRYWLRDSVENFIKGY